MCPRNLGALRLRRSLGPSQRAIQSSDRSMHIYRISTKQGTFEAHAIGKNTRMWLISFQQLTLPKG
ncbi:hypothetical protein L208DRAFT_1386756 [Tricholoma matsutake]|nr:hypothetical protein L208DRAFT_1386756 [Tricholoma matsutake 945]